MCDCTEALSFAAMDRRPPNGVACTHPMIWKVRGGDGHLIVFQSESFLRDLDKA